MSCNGSRRGREQNAKSPIKAHPPSAGLLGTQNALVYLLVPLTEMSVFQSRGGAHRHFAAQIKLSLVSSDRSISPVGQFLRRPASNVLIIQLLPFKQYLTSLKVFNR